MFGIQYPADIKILTNLNIKTTLVLISMGTKNYVYVTYYHRDRCKSSRKFVIYHCWRNISLYIGERLQQTGIETI